MNFESLKQRLSQIAGTQERRLASDVLLLGHVPVVAPEAYLFMLFPGLKEDELQELERQVERPLPNAYKDLLRHTNGMELFVSTITIFGMRHSYAREGDIALQPIDLVDPNTLERPRVPKDATLIGAYQEDGSRLYMQGDDPRVSWVAPQGRPVLKTWPSLELFLHLELDRLHALIGSDYRKVRYDSDTNTLPLAPQSN